MARVRRRWWPRVKEPLRWLACLSAAAVLQGYAYLHVLRHSFTLAIGDRADAVRVTLVPPEREPPALPSRSVPLSELEPSQEPGQRLTPAKPPERPRWEDQPMTDEEARKLLEEARLADGPAALDAETLRQRLEELARRQTDAQPIEPDEQWAKADEMARGVSPDSVRDMADFLGYKAEEYVPRTPPPPGPFDHHDATLYTIEKAVDEAGRDSYRLTLVDREGRTYTFLVPREEDPRQYDQLYRFFQMAEKNESLRLIYRRLLAPIAGRIQRAAWEEKRAQAERRRPSAPQPPRTQPPVAPAKAPD